MNPTGLLSPFIVEPAQAPSEPVRFALRNPTRLARDPDVRLLVRSLFGHRNCELVTRPGRADARRCAS
jgi:hypothetical protein